jgi:hypothetical protein
LSEDSGQHLFTPLLVCRLALCDAYQQLNYAVFAITPLLVCRLALREAYQQPNYAIFATVN